MSEQQKTAIITGASQGIGAALVKAFAERGYRVVANSRTIKPSGFPNMIAIAGDVADPQTAERSSAPQSTTSVASTPSSTTPAFSSRSRLSNTQATTLRQCCP